MHHLSLDESFWRSAAEALASGVPIGDVDPALADVTRLLDRIHQSCDRRPGGWLALLALEQGEAQRVAGVTLAALLSRRGRSILLVDLHFGDDTWPRLLGADDLDGVVDHVAYGVSPSRLVRPTSWGCLSLLPAGTAALNAAATLRSDKLRTCIEAASQGHDLVCVGLAFDDAHAWGSGGTAGVDRAVLIGPRGDELVYERAIPRLVPRVEVLATLDVPPPGRWRPALGAALPALLTDLDERAVAGVPTRAEPEIDFSADLALETAENVAAPARASAGARPVAAAPDAGRPSFHRAERHPSPAPLEAGGGAAGSAPPSTHRSAGSPPYGLPLDVPASAARNDAEIAADVAFLSSASPEPPRTARPAPAAEARDQQPDLGLVLPDPRSLLHELAANWRDADPPRERGEPAPEESRWGMTLLAVALCLLLGAGAFWYWRSNQQIPDGEFTFVETTATPGAGVQAGRSAAGQTAPGVAAEREAEEPGAVAERAPGEAAAGQAGPDDIAAESPEAGDPAAAGETRATDLAGDGRGDATPAEPTPEETERAASSGAEVSARDASGEGASDDGAPDGAGSFTPPAEGPALPFSLHVGSYQSRESARRAAGELERTGQPAFVVPVLLEGKGEWYRVFVGALPDGASSRAGLARALEDGSVKEGTVRETPWALYLGSRPTRAAAAEEVARMRRSGVSAYALGEGPVHLYAGAFESAGDAELLNRQLRDRGFEAALVRRRAAEAP